MTTTKEKQLKKEGALYLKQFLKKNAIHPLQFAARFGKTQIEYWLNVCVPINAAMKIFKHYKKKGVTLHDLRPDLY